MRWLAMISVATWMLVGCGGGDAEVPDPATDSAALAARAPEPVDACALLTTADVAEILGETAGSAAGTVLNQGSAQSAALAQCTYPAVNSAKSITILARRSPVQDNTTEAIAGVRTQVEGGSGVAPEEIAGLGDVAFWGGRQLHVFEGGDGYLILSATGLDDEAAARDALVEAARRALERF